MAELSPRGMSREALTSSALTRCRASRRGDLFGAKGGHGVQDDVLRLGDLYGLLHAAFLSRRQDVGELSHRGRKVMRPVPFQQHPVIGIGQKGGPTRPAGQDE